MESQEVLGAAPVFAGQKDVLAMVAAVGDGMRYAGRQHPRWAGHRGLVSLYSILQMLWTPSPRPAARRRAARQLRNRNSWYTDPMPLVGRSPFTGLALPTS